MTSTRVVIDAQREWRPAAPNLVEVTSEDGYYEARLHLRAARNAGEPVTIWVTNAGLARRFDDLRSDLDVEVVEYDARRELARAMDVPEVPDVLTADLIRECDLLARARSVPRRADESPLGWALRAVLGEPWGRRSVSGSELSTVLESLGSADQTLPAMGDLVELQLRQWQRDCGRGDVWGWLADDPLGRARCLLACWATQDSDERQVQWLSQEGYNLDEIEEAKRYVPALPADLRVPAATVGPRLRQLIVSKLEARLADAGACSLANRKPRVHEELAAVASYVNAKAAAGEPLREEESDSLAAWVRGHEQTPSGSPLAIMADLLRERPVPGPLPSNAEWVAVKRWLSREYLPAYATRAVCGRLAETADLVASFETWLTGNYHGLMMREDVGLHWFTGRAGENLAEGAVLLFILDGVPFLIVQRLRERLASEAGLKIASEDVYLSLLPTTTAVNKASLLTGRLPEKAEGSVEAALAHALGTKTAHVSLVRRPQLSIAEMDALQPGHVLAYHLLGVDQDLLHKPKSAVDRWLSAYAAVDDVAGGVLEFARGASQRGLPIWIGCINDHGWTELPRDAERVETPDDLAESIEHGRIIGGTADARYGIPLESAQFFLRESYTIAGGYRYFGTRPHGAVHGGATPQEVSVLGFWATNTELPTLADIGLEVAGEVTRAVARNSVVLRLLNANAVPIEITHIELAAIELGRGDLPVTLPAHGTGELPVICDASTARDMLTITGAMQWRWRGGLQTQRVCLQVPTAGAARAARAFEDMFDR